MSRILSFSLPDLLTESALEEAVPLLESAEAMYADIQMYAAQCDVLFLLAVVHHNLGDTERRDNFALRHETAQARREGAHSEVVEPWIEDVWAIVAEVGAAIASR